MATDAYLPHIDVLLQALRVSRDRLDSRSKIAVDPRLFMKMMRQVIAALPFDEAFYLTTYDDVATAHGNGEIGDLHSHFINAGFFEGRLGTDPSVDKDYYLRTYPDVRRAIGQGQIGSADEHFVQRGAAEGRSPNPESAAMIERWIAVLRPDG